MGDEESQPGISACVARKFQKNEAKGLCVLEFIDDKNSMFRDFLQTEATVLIVRITNKQTGFLVLVKLSCRKS